MAAVAPCWPPFSPRGARSQDRALARAPSPGRALQLLGAVRRWATRPSGLSCCVVRHGERADASWDSQWPLSQDAVDFPVDPPLTARGAEQARAVGAELMQQRPRGGWGAVVCSPYLRCVETALAICEATGAPMLLDHQWAEVVTESHEMVSRSKRLHRSHAALRKLIESRGIVLRSKGRIAGRPVADAENLVQARVRYAQTLLRYVDRARLSRTSVIVVTHGEALLPALALAADPCPQVNAVGYCAYVQCDVRAHPAAPRRKPTADFADLGTPAGDEPAPFGPDGSLEPHAVEELGGQHLALTKHTLQVAEGRAFAGSWLGAALPTPMRDAAALLEGRAPPRGRELHWAPPGLDLPEESEVPTPDVVVLPRAQDSTPIGHTTLLFGGSFIASQEGTPIGQTPHIFGDSFPSQEGSRLLSLPEALAEERVPALPEALEEKVPARPASGSVPSWTVPAGAASPVPVAPLRAPGSPELRPLASSLMQRRMSAGARLPALGLAAPRAPQIVADCSLGASRSDTAPSPPSPLGPEASGSPNALLRIAHHTSMPERG